HLESQRLRRIQDVLPPSGPRPISERFGTGGPAGENLLARARILESRVYLPQSVDLALRQAGVALKPLACEHTRVEVAAARIVNHAVLNAIERVTRRNGRPGDQVQLRVREQLRPVLIVGGNPGPEISGGLVNTVISGITGDNPVVIFRKTLRFGK